MLNRMGYDHVKLLACVYDVLNCFRNLVALYFLCESFPAKQAEDIKRVKRFNIGGGWNIYFSWKKGKSIRCLSELVYAVAWSKLIMHIIIYMLQVSFHITIRFLMPQWRDVSVNLEQDVKKVLSLYFDAIGWETEKIFFFRKFDGTRKISWQRG